MVFHSASAADSNNTKAHKKTVRKYILNVCYWLLTDYTKTRITCSHKRQQLLSTFQPWFTPQKHIIHSVHPHHGSSSDGWIRPGVILKKYFSRLTKTKFLKLVTEKDILLPLLYATICYQTRLDEIF